MNFKYLICLLLTALIVTASNNIERRTTRPRIRTFVEAHKLQTSGFTTEERRYLLSAMIRKRSYHFRWNSFQDLALLVEDFMAIGADLNKRDYYGKPVLTKAAWRGDLKAVTLLLDYGADVNATDSDGETALSLSILYSHQEISYLLLERGADPFIGKTLQHAIRGEFIPDRIIPCIGMIEPDSKLANELAHVFVEDEVSLSVRRYLFPSRPFLDACLDNITNKERLQELFQKAVKKWRVTVVQALLERGCSWRQLDLKLFLIESKREVINLMSFFGALRPPTMVGLAMAEFIKMGLLEGATLDEMDDLLYLLKMMEYDDLHAEVLKAYREKERENSYWTCNIS